MTQDTMKGRAMTQDTEDVVALDMTPTGAFKLPRWKYQLRAAAACLEADPPLTREFRKSVSDMLGRHQTAIQSLSDRIDELEGQLNTPEVDDWAKGAVLEAAHQRERWGVDHDAGKSPFDWFWLVGYLAQKAAASAVAGDLEKAKHHTISTGAALANWHLALSGTDTIMRPGIGPGNGGDKVGSAYDLAARAALHQEGIEA